MYIKKRKICFDCSWQNNSNQNNSSNSLESPKRNNKKCCKSIIIKNIPRNIFLNGDNEEYIKHSQSNQNFNHNMFSNYHNNLPSSRNNTNSIIPTNNNPSCSKLLFFTSSTNTNSFNKQNSNINNNNNDESNIDDSDINEPTFRPLLNKHSLLIASKLPPFTFRLSQDNKKRKLKKMLIATYNNKYVYRNDSFNVKSNSPKSINPINHSFYQRGIDMINKRNAKIKEAIIEKETNYLRFSYKPEINKTSSVFQINKKGDIYQRGKIWKLKVDKKINKIKRQEINKEINICKFNPQINSCKINKLYNKGSNNILKENFNQKNGDWKGKNKYVKRKNGCLNKKKESEDYFNRKFGEKSSSHKDFMVCGQSNKKNKGHNKTRSINDKITYNKLNEIRSELGIESFFDDC